MKNMLAVSLFFLLIFSASVSAQTILFLGDSLTEGYGVDRSEAYPEQVKIMFKQKLNKEINIINGGVSGSTTASGLSRLKWYLKKKPNLMLLALGANDGLRGLSVEESKKNLEEIVDYAQSQGVKVVLAGMLMPPNYGPQYTEKYKKMFEQIKKKKKLSFIPFLLEGVAAQKKYNLKDGIHPNPEGHKVIAEKVFKTLKDQL